MDEVEQNTKPKRARVLRAADIIPPFDNIPAPADAEEGGLEPSELAALQAEPVGAQPESDPGADVGESGPAGQDSEPSPAAEGEIPRYDLAENILAEQRRLAARRRRAPSPSEEEPPASPEPSGPRPSEPEMSAEDLPELQRIVAEIVARDIERLCRKPNVD